jgi:Uma2 family endonuclease
MTAARALADAPLLARETDQHVSMRLGWDAYEAMLAWRGDGARPRMTYLGGELELMSPACDHETQKKILARLLEAWAEETDTPLEGAGSWTVKDPNVEAGAEADECYALGSFAGKRAPDIAIEVVWTRGGIDKLEVWRKLGAREVWFWSHGQLSFWVLRRERYASAPRSALLPGLDPALITRCMAAPSQTEAVKQLRASFKKTSKPRSSGSKRRSR